MWHRKKRRRLGVTTPHRKALLRNLVRGLVLHREIETTVARAKETSRLTEKMITIAKEGTLAARRQLIRRLGSSEVAKELIDQIAPRFKERAGGYTRVLKLGWRPGDGAQRALIQFSVPIEMVEKEKRPKKEKKAKAAPEVKEAEKPVKKETKPESRKKEEKKVSDVEEKKEASKKGGFLSGLRKFFKGDEEKH